MIWTAEDKKLVSCGAEGAIYEWDMTNFKRIGEVVHKDISYWDIALHSSGTLIYAVGSDDLLKEIQSSNVSDAFKQTAKLTNSQSLRNEPII